MLSLIAAVTPFAISMVLSPGPNNLMVTTSAVNFGLRRTWPHLLGITAGFPVMLVAIGLGLGSVFERIPAIHTVLKYVGAAYCLYLAYAIATSAPVREGEASGRPFSFWQAALFQWVNPKAWIIALTAIATFTPVGDRAIERILVIAAVFAVVTLPSIFIWAAFGTALARWLRTPRTLRIFNCAMAGLLVLSLIPIFL